MTMHNALHPDDERLAAYAGGDADAVTDRQLVAHLSTCDRCQPMVDELSMLRGALAVLPDLPPSRPLRLIPPVPAPAAPRVGPLEWLRRLAAPAMAAGAGLVLVGAVGASGFLGQLDGKAASLTSTQEEGASSGPNAPAAGGAPSLAPSPRLAASPGRDGAEYTRSNEPSGESAEATAESTAASGLPAPGFGVAGHPPDAFGPAPAEQPWLTLLIAGFALFGISAVLRYSLTPRAG